MIFKTTLNEHLKATLVFQARLCSGDCLRKGEVLTNMDFYKFTSTIQEGLLSL